METYTRPSTDQFDHHQDEAKEPSDTLGVEATNKPSDRRMLSQPRVNQQLFFTPPQSPSPSLPSAPKLLRVRPIIPHPINDDGFTLPPSVHFH